MNPTMFQSIRAPRADCVSSYQSSMGLEFTNSSTSCLGHSLEADDETGNGAQRIDDMLVDEDVLRSRRMLRTIYLEEPHSKDETSGNASRFKRGIPLSRLNDSSGGAWPLSSSPRLATALPRLRVCHCCASPMTKNQRMTGHHRYTSATMVEPLLSTPMRTFLKIPPWLPQCVALNLTIIRFSSHVLPRRGLYCRTLIRCAIANRML